MWNHYSLWLLYIFLVQNHSNMTPEGITFNMATPSWHKIIMILHYSVNLPCVILSNDCNLCWRFNTPKTAAFKYYNVTGIDTRKLNMSSGSDVLSTDTCCFEIDKRKLLGNLALRLKCLRLVSLSLLCPKLLIIYTHILVQIYRQLFWCIQSH